MDSNSESQIETTVEVISEIPESIKQQLKQKRKKLKEKKLKPLAEERHFDSEAIELDAGEEALLKDKKLPEIRPRQLNVSKSADSWFSSEDDLSCLGQTYNQYTSEKGKPIPPPRKNKKSYELQELASFQSKSEELTTAVCETSIKNALVKIPDEEQIKNEINATEPKKLPRKRVKKERMKKDINEHKTEDSSVTASDEISEADAIDFFTKVWEESPDSEPQETPIEEASQDDDDSIGLIRKELQDRLMGTDIVKYERATYIPFQTKIEKENVILFYPSSKPVPMHLKLPEGKEPRNFEEEGFYVGKRPFITRSNINRMENRLVTQKELQWFGEDGRIKLSEEPVNDNPVRHLYEGCGEIPAEVEYVKAEVLDDKWRIKGDKGRRYQLDLDISCISFLHHPLFSAEHVIESRLLQMYQKYLYNEKIDVVDSLKQRLKALRLAASKLKQSMQMGMEETSVNNERLSRLKQYQNDIRQTKKIRDLKEEEQNILWKSILNAWDELKTCRKNQGFTSTSLNLTVNKEKTNEKQEKEEFESELQDELEEEMEDYESCSEKLLQQYEEDMRKWKQWNKAVKSARKREKMRKQFEDSNPKEGESSKVSDELSETKAEDEKLLSEPEMLKPKPVAKFNPAMTLEKLRNNALKMRRRPGDPKLHVTVDHDVPITPSNQCPRAEAQRRNAVSKTKLYFKIMFNNKKVAETCKRNLTQDFKAVWGQIFKLQIVHYPQTFKVEIFENGFFERYHMAELYIPLPTISETALNVKLVDLQFSSDQVVIPKNNAVGCGVPYKLANGTETYLLLNGFLKCSLVWGVSETGAVLVPDDIESPTKKNRKFVPLSHMKASKFSDTRKMKQWIKKSNLDPLNPENIELFKLFQDMGLNSNSTSDDTTNKESLMDPFEFCSMEDIENNKRFQLLQLRNKDPTKYRNLVMIPPSEEDLTEDMLEYLNESSENTDLKELENGDQAQREKSKLLMQKVREEVAQRFYVSQHQKMLEDIVQEEKVPSIGTIGFSLLKLLQPKRPLYPSRKERKKVTCTNTTMDVKIIIKIQHASNVPVRMDVDPIKQTKDSDYTTIQIESQVQPFVEVMFQRMAVKTGIAEGPHPTWNQELELPFQDWASVCCKLSASAYNKHRNLSIFITKHLHDAPDEVVNVFAPNDNYSPANLESVKDVIYINLFDEVTVNLLEDDAEQDTVVYERLERRWLGNFKIPFATLYLNSKIEGAFRINVPPVLLSYHNEPRPWLSGLSGASENHTYLSFFMTIEPCLQLPEVFRDQGDSAEPDKILYEVEKWQQSVIPRYPDRTIKLMSVDLSGEWIFITRFLHPLIPPEGLMTANKESIDTLETLARFVSLIPTVADSITFPGLCDIWSTSEQFLQMLIGDEEEHSMLLCNYFLHLGKKAMLLLGSGIPEGPTAYVVTWEKEGTDVWVWNASTGDHFSVRDNRNPLQSVGCLINPENVWANIQRNVHPSRINFDLTKSSEWKPFFYRGFPNPGLKSVQPEYLTYTPTDPNYVEQLRESLESNLQDSIIKWRQKTSTTWNSDCSRVLYKILTRLERNAGRTASDDSLQELEQILKTHKMNGFPLSMPYTDSEAVIESVFSTGVHLIEDKNAEYSVAVYIHPYPCSVLAVWVYVAVLIRRKTNSKKSEDDS